MQSPFYAARIYLAINIFLSVSADIAQIRLANDIFSRGGSNRFMNCGREGARGHSKQMRRCLETRVCFVLLHLWLKTFYEPRNYTVLGHRYYPLFIPHLKFKHWSSPYFQGRRAPLDSCLYYYLLTEGQDALCVIRLYLFNNNPTKYFIIYGFFYCFFFFYTSMPVEV